MLTYADVCAQSDWADSTCFHFDEHIGSDEHTEISVKASVLEYVVVLELTAEDWNAEIRKSPMTQASVQEFLETWRQERALSGYNPENEAARWESVLKRIQNRWREERQTAGKELASDWSLQKVKAIQAKEAQSQQSFASPKKAPKVEQIDTQNFDYVLQEFEIVVRSDATASAAAFSRIESALLASARIEASMLNLSTIIHGSERF
jgi:hypothetical protein